jgi:tRNA(Ile)-lysidine synthase
LDWGLAIRTPHLSQAESWLSTSSLTHGLPQSLAVGWSGGVDSTALLLALHNQGFQVQAWHIDHAWHKKSSDDTQQLSKLAESWGIPFLSQRLAEAATSNREAHARQGRYQAFQAMARETGICSIALGHHADDQAETICMRMLQGAGVMGCRGISPQSCRNGLDIYRPLLHVRRASLEIALQKKGVECLHDASNDDVSLWRNRIRSELFPKMLSVGIDPYALFMRWQKQAVKLANMVDAGADNIALHAVGSACSILWYDWQNLSQAVRAQVLQRMAAFVLGEGVVFGRRHIELIEFWQKKGGRGGLDLSACRLSRRGSSLHLESRKAISRA